MLHGFFNIFALFSLVCFSFKLRRRTITVFTRKSTALEQAPHLRREKLISAAVLIRVNAALQMLQP